MAAIAKMPGLIAALADGDEIAGWRWLRGLVRIIATQHSLDQETDLLAAATCVRLIDQEDDSVAAMDQAAIRVYVAKAATNVVESAAGLPFIGASGPLEHTFPYDERLDLALRLYAGLKSDSTQPRPALPEQALSAERHRLLTAKHLGRLDPLDAARLEEIERPFNQLHRDEHQEIEEGFAASRAGRLEANLERLERLVQSLPHSAQP